MARRSSGLLGNRLVRWLSYRCARLAEGRHGSKFLAACGLAGSATALMATLALLSDDQQLVVAAAGIVLFFVVDRREGGEATLFLKILSLVVSFRYVAWRLTETVEWRSWPQAFLSTGLLLAEGYALMMLVLSYFQTLHPLERKPVPLPDDVSAWPSVDVYVPTYNEDLAIVRGTVLACMSMDWPADRLNVYILDDGHREEFLEFAQACGAGYISRPNNAHAKAGNLNHAMSVTRGEYIAIFDCDHVPTRAFLQTTMGWFLVDPGVGLVQTPHHFYSADPFQRNLSEGRNVPPESNVFYGLVQDGSDFWNASFFCGSCAVLRRRALDQVGGIATETVTEDSHTALKMQRLGWSTAYLRMPLAAGLATERLILHIGQRIRWARGMIQILRLDNPLLGRGLTLPQRLCYFSAMAGFLFAIPRLVFLSAPLSYLLFNQTLIAASPVALLAYAAPHFFHCIATSSRVQKNWRYSFWSEIYETVLALFLVRITIVTLLMPRLGKFNVTDKGGILDRSYTDWRAIYPNLVFLSVLACGAGWGVWRLLAVHNDRLTIDALWTNLAWIGVSMLIVLVAITVGHETRQVRRDARIAATLPVTLRTADGRLCRGTTIDVSRGGCRVQLDLAAGETFVSGASVHMLLEPHDPPVSARALALRDGVVNLQWTPATLQDEARLIRFVFGRADAWVSWADYPPDRPLRSLWMIVSSLRSLATRGDRPASASRDAHAAKAARRARQSVSVNRRRSVTVEPRKTGAPLMLAGMLALSSALLFPGVVRAETSPAGPIPPPVDPAALTPASVDPAAPIPSGPPPSTSAPSGGDDAVLLPEHAGASQGGDAVPAAPPAAQPAQPADAPAGDLPGTSTRTRTLRQFGAPQSLRMTPFGAIQGLNFGIPGSQVVTAAHLTLSGAISPALLPSASSVTVRLNDQYIGTIPADRDHPTFGPVTFQINPVFFLGQNTINFTFAGQEDAVGTGGQGCSNPYSGMLWAEVSGQSTLALTTAPLPPRRILSHLPAPFLDPTVAEPAVVPFVLPAGAEAATLKPAAVVASWFGRLADFHRVGFPVSETAPASGNAVAVGVLSRLPPAITKGVAVGGPTLAEIANPNDPFGTILLVTGRTEDEVAAAARTLVFMPESLASAPSQTVVPVSVPARRPYDAPAFIPTDRVVRFGELVSVGALQGYGYVPGTLAVPFRISPDLYTWRDRPFIADFRIHTPLASNFDLQQTRVDVSLNGLYLHSYAWRPPRKLPGWIAQYLPLDSALEADRLALPPWGVYGQNELQFYFDGRPMARRDCSVVAQDMAVSVDPDSTLDFRRAHHFTTLPNLAYFANSGFPFTRMADLSDTVVVLPDQPGPAVATAFLDLMGVLGSYTWFPAERVTIVGAGGIGAVADRDLLVMGMVQNSGPIATLLGQTPYRIENGRLRVAERSILNGIRYAFADAAPDALRTVTVNGSLGLESGGALIGARSPFAAHRSMVMMLAGTPQGLDELVHALQVPTRQRGIQGDLTVINGDKIVASRNGPTYTVGTLPWWLWFDWFLRGHPVRVTLFAALGALVAGLALHKEMSRRAARRKAYLDPRDAPGPGNGDGRAQ
ncbi:cellulose synthase catalytic subunit [Gluconacetobacter johannae DSM 13595]|uniref:Cellulose synthase n=1 Tax=Gluconacetobacter johannae TaxID=112140 RepID=A0A7W4J8W6_9PROT|nr:UDP-forming cellulose synthase catalytic subunit [Gluconacetobacter johannae]MBB2176855.1 UDP-forming cellulose synthase catalytic subunit [Gluconacetobacter johannae]GBQ86424.1 cellulose synthase catalytic subunit [Gluconacetobacter johannae DSM 13595]